MTKVYLENKFWAIRSPNWI